MNRVAISRQPGEEIEIGVGDRANRSLEYLAFAQRLRITHGVAGKRRNREAALRLLYGRHNHHGIQMKSFALPLAFFSLLVLPVPASAADAARDYPARPIRLIMGNAPGSS